MSPNPIQRNAREPKPELTERQKKARSNTLRQAQVLPPHQVDLTLHPVTQEDVHVPAHVNGADLDLSSFFPGVTQPVDVPTYAFQRRRFWLPSGTRTDARSLGLSPARTLKRVHLPLLRRGLLTAGLLVFIDVMKELPATLVMRPFNFDTLATQAYTLASDERLAEASTSAIAIVAVGLLPMIVLCRQIAKERVA